MSSIFLFLLLIIVLVKQSGAQAYNTNNSEEELLILCRGDRDLMERLISHELEKTPIKTRARAIGNAINLYIRDNH